jgi:hypothetical protein
MIKGLVRVDDAMRVADTGATALSVSNHGGNNLDGTPASIRALPAVVEAVGGTLEVVIDGGIRRGSDVVKALALGARAAMLGRAYLWRLAANGQAGVENVLDVLRNASIRPYWRSGGARSVSSLPTMSSCPKASPDGSVFPDDPYPCTTTTTLSPLRTPPPVDLTPRLLDHRTCSDPAQRWASSGGMWLTGREDGPTLGAPASVPTVLDDLAASFVARASVPRHRVQVDGAAFIGERAALRGLARAGDVSCGGSARLMRSRDGWVAVSLPRPDDLELLPAWVGIRPDVEPWAALARVLYERSAAEAVSSGAELGLAVGRLGERAHERAAAIAQRVGSAPAATVRHGLRVVDLSSLWAGPLCGQLLAEAGLDVIKVESRQRPDGARQDASGFFDLLNGTKASVALDLPEREDVEILRRLLLTADVVIEASRPRALEQLGITVEDVLDRGATRVWVSITAHGRDGAHRHRVGFGDDAAVAGGLVATDVSGPVFCADAIADPATGLLAAVAVLELLAAGGRWLMDVALARTAALLATGPTTVWTGPVATPRARPITSRAPALGRDTARVVQSLDRHA